MNDGAARAPGGMREAELAALEVVTMLGVRPTDEPGLLPSARFAWTNLAEKISQLCPCISQDEEAQSTHM
jgi:hypothetical protein